MSNRRVTTYVLLASLGAGALVAATAGHAFAQESKGRQPAAQPAPKPDAKPAAAPQPGHDQAPPGTELSPMHKHLDNLVGTWEGGVKFKMGDQWAESKGTCKRELDMDGRFVIERVDSSPAFEGAPRFKGLGIVGYNTLQNKYESVWIDNMGTYVSTSTGTFDEKAKTFTFEGDMFDPMKGTKTRQRTVIDCSNPRTETMTGYAVGADGKLDKNFEGTFTKR